MFCPLTIIVNDMNSKILMPILIATVLSGCVSTATVDDPVRVHAIAEVARARADSSLPLTEAQYVYPNWAGMNKAP